MDNCERLEAIVASMTEVAVIATDGDGRIEMWNPGAERIFGYDAAEVHGRSMDFVFTPEDRAARTCRRLMDQALQAGRAEEMHWSVCKDGRRIWVEGVIVPVRDGRGALTGFACMLRDSTSRRSDDERIGKLARFDPLTGLANRLEFNERFVDLSAAALRHQRLLILQLIDLDHFKQVNDSFGHAIGDQLLQQAARRVRAIVRDSDFVARLGGDEFVVLLPDALTPEVGGAVADKIVDVLSRPFYIEGHEAMISASIGIAVFPQDGTDSDLLLRNADLALYKVKGNSRSGYQYFTDELDDMAHQRSRALRQLRSAVARGDFTLHYQPQIDGHDGRVTGVEALLRCTDPDLGSVPVAELVQLACDSGLMREIGMWTLDQTCRQARAWEQEGLPLLKVCVNLSAAQLRNPRLPEELAAILERTGLSADRMELEITERDLFELPNGRQAVHALRALGVSIAIDDFGAGPAALNHLGQVQADRIKLDRSLARDVATDRQQAAIASAIVGVAHTLQMGVVVEGVESAEQVRFFRDQDCEVLQGFYFSPPLPADALAAWIRTGRPCPRVFGRNHLAPEVR